MKKRLMMAALAVALSGAPLQAADLEAGEALANGVCMACHGQEGNSIVPLWPKLAGQHPEYIYKQLMDFKSGTRENVQMSPQAAPLSEEDMRNVAAYFTLQTISEGPPVDPEEVEKGRRLFQAGNPETGVPSCAACHGPRGLGLNLARFPRLAGQHQTFVENSLKEYRSGTRANDPNAMMRGAAASMTDEEIAAVADYIQSMSY